MPTRAGWLVSVVALAACTREAHRSPPTSTGERVTEAGDPHPTEAAPAAPAEVTASAPCPAGVREVLVDTTAHRLKLCDDGTALAELKVALGEGGVGKHDEGDKRTPLGVYSLAAPRKSINGYYTFIPVGYPTGKQKKAGFTGGAVGIHGPPERMPEFEATVTSYDWTWGCIALAKADLDRVVAWVRSENIGTVELVAGS